jgi:hypothetical protein
MQDVPSYSDVRRFILEIEEKIAEEGERCHEETCNLIADIAARINQQESFLVDVRQRLARLDAMLAALEPPPDPPQRIEPAA